jgi:PIN domain nuclease of toxin-antitoxin system
LDTHLLLWAAGSPERLPARACELILDEANELLFSSASFWEIVIKLGLGRQDLRIDPLRLRRLLVANGYSEVAVTTDHALAVGSLPLLHKDPFDRILLAQAKSEGLCLLTVDRQMAAYGDSVIEV